MRSTTLKLQVRDITTRETFSVPATSNTEFVVTQDGVKVKLHPMSLRTLTKPGAKFDGHTLLGPRPMERISMTTESKLLIARIIIGIMGTAWLIAYTVFGTKIRRTRKEAPKQVKGDPPPTSIFDPAPRSPVITARPRITDSKMHIMYFQHHKRRASHEETTSREGPEQG